MIREAVILAGGQGSRLRSVLTDVPKPLAPVAGRPFLDILCSWLARQGLQRVIFSLGYMADVIVKHVGKNFMGMDTNCVVEEKPLGTGGGLRLALEQCQEDAVLVLNGDTFLEFDLSALSRCWDATHQPILLAVQVADSSRYGRLTLRGNLVIGLEEKGILGAGWINAGGYVLPRQALNSFTLGQPFSLEDDFLKPCLCDEPFQVYRTDGFFIDIGVPEDYCLAQIILKNILYI